MTCAQGLLRLLWGGGEVGMLRDCFKALSNDAMKPSKMKRHLMGKLRSLLANSSHFFKENVKNPLRKKKAFTKSLLSN